MNFGRDILINRQKGREPKSVAPKVLAVLGERFELENVYLASEHGGWLPDSVIEVLLR